MVRVMQKYEQIVCPILITYQKIFIALTPAQFAAAQNIVNKPTKTHHSSRQMAK